MSHLSKVFSVVTDMYPELVDLIGWFFAHIPKDLDASLIQYFHPVLHQLSMLYQIEVIEQLSEQSCNDFLLFLVRFSEIDDASVDLIMDNMPISGFLVALLQVNNHLVCESALRIIGNILTGEGVHCETLLKHGLLDHLNFVWINQGNNLDI